MPNNIPPAVINNNNNEPVKFNNVLVIIENINFWYAYDVFERFL